jgi:spore coat protein CotH
VILGAATLGQGGKKEKAQTGDSEPVQGGDDLFNEARIIKFKIQLSKSAIDALDKSPYSYVGAQVEEEGGPIYPNVGLRLKGARSFRPIDKKPNFSLKFNEYMPDQMFHGLRRVLLNNAIEEKTYVQEYLGDELFRAVGTPAPRVNYARVELNGRDLGLYVLVEGITRDFLERNFGASKGNLYEGVEADIDGELEQDYGKRSRRQDLVPLINATREKDRAKRWEELGKTLNLDQFIGYIALEALINVWDGYSLRLNNYRIYCDHNTGKATFIPHGLDNFFVVSDAPLTAEMKGAVTVAVLETSEGRKRYIEKMHEICASVLNREDLHRRVDELAAKVRPALTELGQAKAQERALRTYHTRIDRRLDFIAEQLPRLMEGEGGKRKKSRN